MRDNFQFWKNITDNSPIKVKVSLNIFNITVLIKLVRRPTSFVKFEINFPECLLSINFVSASIKLSSIFTCTSFLTSSETPIIITLAIYKDRPFTENAVTINIGIIIINV